MHSECIRSFGSATLLRMLAVHVLVAMATEFAPCRDDARLENVLVVRTLRLSSGNGRYAPLEAPLSFSNQSAGLARFTDDVLVRNVFGGTAVHHLRLAFLPRSA